MAKKVCLMAQAIEKHVTIVSFPMKDTKRAQSQNQGKIVL